LSRISTGCASSAAVTAWCAKYRVNRTLITAIVLLCLSACGTIATPAPPTVTPLAEVKKFVDDSAGFAFDYPADWIILASSTILSFEPDFNSGYEGSLPPGETHIDVSTFRNLAEMDTLQKSLTKNDSNMVQETEIWQLSPTIKATWVHHTFPATDYSDEAEVERLFAIINGHGVLIACFGNTTPCSPIMRSLRPLASAS
jgi:hypothetical protein